MATVEITEYARNGNHGEQAPQEPSEAWQAVNIAGTSTQSSAFGSNTRLIRIITDTAFRYAIGANPTALGNSGSKIHNVNGEYFRTVRPGEKIAVIAVS